MAQSRPKKGQSKTKGKNTPKIILNIQELIRSKMDLNEWYDILWKEGKGGVELTNPVNGIKYTTRPNHEILFKLAEYGYGKPDTNVNVELTNGEALKRLGEVLSDELKNE